MVAHYCVFVAMILSEERQFRGGVSGGVLLSLNVVFGIDFQEMGWGEDGVGFKLFEGSNPSRPWLTLGLMGFSALLCLLKFSNDSVEYEPWLPWGPLFFSTFHVP